MLSCFYILPDEKTLPYNLIGVGNFRRCYLSEISRRTFLKSSCSPFFKMKKGEQLLFCVHSYFLKSQI